MNLAPYIYIINTIFYLKKNISLKLIKFRIITKGSLRFLIDHLHRSLDFHSLSYMQSKVLVYFY